MIEDVQPDRLLWYRLHKPPHGIAGGAGEGVVCPHDLREGTGLTLLTHNHNDLTLYQP